MRIISGLYRRRLLQSPPAGSITRPLPDRVKESLCNHLRGRFEGATVFDAFAGVGSFALEAASRGAAQVVCVEKDRNVAATLRSNIEMLGAEDVCQIVTGDALGAAALAQSPIPADIQFFDPPYAMVENPNIRSRVLRQVAACIERLAPDGYAILRTPWPLPHEPVRLDTEEDLDGTAWLEKQNPAPPVPPVPDADLTIPGALGPDTYTYGGMALHFYMRSTDAS